MVAVIALLVVVVGIGAAAWALRRRSVDDTHSVEGYRHTLDTLESLRTQSSSVKVRQSSRQGTASTTGGRTDQGVDEHPDDRLPPPGASGSAGPTTEDPGPPRAERGALVFGEGIRSAPDAAEVSRSRARRDRAVSSMNRRPRRLGGPIAAGAAVVLVVAVLAYIGARSPHGSPHASPHPSAPATSAHAHSTTVRTTTPHPPSTTSSHKVSTPPTASHRGRVSGVHAAKPPASTPTTLPRQYTPVTSTPTTATYTPVAASYSLSVGSSSGRCWVLVTSSSGATLFTGTLAPGQLQTVPATGTTSVQIGAPTVVTLAVDGKPVYLPAGYQTPFVVTFQPAA